MGNHSILDAKQHILKLILDTHSPTQASDIESLVHSIEILLACEHTEAAMERFVRPNQDFPTELNLD